MKTERSHPQPPPDRAAAIVAAIEGLRREVVSLRQVIYDAHHPSPLTDWVPGREPTQPPAPLPSSAEPAVAVTADAAGLVPEQPTHAEKQKTITIAGQVERAPVLTRTPRGKPLAIFSLAVVTDGEPGEVHSILAFDARGAKARSNIRRGDRVGGMGYPHPLELPQPDGTTRTISEVYALRVIRTSDRKALV